MAGLLPEGPRKVHMGLPPSHCVEKHDLPEKLSADLRGHRSESQDLLVWRRIWLSGALGRGGRPGPAPGVGGITEGRAQEWPRVL